eukprot:TRINITY_DN2644_c0_g3_i4.p1 TRINITY_DN2644_c0_g3~~TRINITY_DN2644_c0_g3_i4.p1  ORF type:complete len:504 (-),score=113.73 TRINITY_DN2644_c0_g3_i4:60-1571(-)
MQELLQRFSNLATSDATQLRKEKVCKESELREKERQYDSMQKLLSSIDVSSIERENQAIANEVREREQRKNELKEKMLGASKILAESNQTLLKLDNELNLMKKNEELEVSRIKSLEEQCDRFGEELSQIEDNHGALEDVKLALQNLLGGCNKVVEKKNQSGELKERNNVMSDQLKSLAQLKEERESYADTIKKRNDDKHASMERLYQEISELKELNGGPLVTPTSLEELTRQIDESQALYKKLSLDTNDMHEENCTLEEKIMTLDSSIQELEILNGELTAQKGKFCGESIHSKIFQKQNKICQLEEELKAKKSELDKYEKRVEQLQSELKLRDVDKLNEECRRLQQQKDSYASVLEDLREDVKTIEKLIVPLSHFPQKSRPLDHTLPLEHAEVSQKLITICNYLHTYAHKSILIGRFQPDQQLVALIPVNDHFELYDGTQYLNPRPQIKYILDKDVEDHWRQAPIQSIYFGRVILVEKQVAPPDNLYHLCVGEEYYSVYAEAV